MLIHAPDDEQSINQHDAVAIVANNWFIRQSSESCNCWEKGIDKGLIGMIEIVSAKTFKRLVLILSIWISHCWSHHRCMCTDTLLKAPILSLLPMDILIGIMIWH